VTNANGGLAFAKLVNAGYAAVKAVYPNAQVIVHHSNAQDLGANTWFYNLIKSAGAKFDMIGLSLYPSYWADGKYPDWKPYCQSAVSNIKTLNSTYQKPVMLVEFGMPVSEPAKAKEALKYILDGVKSYDWFKGVFYWEPESEHDRNNYDYGCFASGKSTGVMELFK
jgi:arabinogalactan endo-1,4-beta-galactosidase